MLFERADWVLFRTIEGLSQKAGVPVHHLRRLVLKELADNAFDSGTIVRYGPAESGRYFVEDDGPGLDGTPEEIANLFSIARPLRSSKLLRRSQRGQLGNGLRVVAGAVLASNGLLVVTTGCRRIILRPETDGTTTVADLAEYPDPQVGTRIEIGFGPALPDDDDPFAWVQLAGEIANHGKRYTGRSSPFWYDAANFHELLLAAGDQPVRSPIAELDGCGGAGGATASGIVAAASGIVAAASLERTRCKDADRAQAERLLLKARSTAEPVNINRLGSVGPDALPDYYCAKEQTAVVLGGSQPQADIPATVEAWALKLEKQDQLRVRVMINRTPSVAPLSAWRNSDKNICLQGNGLLHYSTDAPKKGAFDIVVNLTVPFCPITSDGKAPDLKPFAGAIMGAVAAAMRKAQKAAPKRKVSIKSVVLDNLDDAIAAASGDGDYRFNERQIFYQVRPIVLEEIGEELKLGNFKGIITDYENERGEIPGMYREPRGSIYHPHRDQEIPLGTLIPGIYRMARREDGRGGDRQAHSAGRGD
jgi:hypothetical protein